jgi:hypothetical protein
MPKIPTFTSTATLTTQSPEVKSTFQMPLTGGPAAGLNTGLEKLNEFYVAKQNLQDTVEAKKNFFEIKGTTDTFLDRQKNNYNEEDAIANYTKDFQEHTKLALAKIPNGDVRQKVQQELQLELGQGILKIKKNSFDILEKESNAIYNSGQTTDAASYEQNVGNPLEQYKYSDQIVRRAEQYADQWKLSDIDKRLKVDSAKTLLFLSDVKTQVMNSENPTEKFLEIYTNKDAQTFIKDQDLPKLLIETFKNSISNMAVKGDINSDYAKAVNLVDQLENLKRPDGTKIITDKNLSDWNSFKEKVYAERYTHDEMKQKANNDAEVVKFSDDQKEKVTNAFFNKFSTGTDLTSTKGKETAALASDEYDQEISRYLAANKNATNLEKKTYAKDTANRIIEKYSIMNSDNFKVYDSKNNKINYHFLFSELETSAVDYKNNPSNDHPLAKQAKVFGYVDKKGNPDVNSFLKANIPVLKQRLADQ